jgi:predicted dehydrogenase
MGPARRVLTVRGTPRQGEGHCHFHAAIEFVSGAVGSFQLDNRTPLPREQYRINCVSEDTLVATHLELHFRPPQKIADPPRVVRRRIAFRGWSPEAGNQFEDEVEEYARPDLTGADERLIGSGYLGEHEAFVAALLNGDPPGPTFAETVHSMEVAETIQAGASREF